MTSPDLVPEDTVPRPDASPPAAPPPGSPAAPGSLSRRDRSVITLLLISAFVVILNETILSVALPPIMADLRIPASTAQWLTTAFMLTMAVVIPVTGFLIQRLTTRALFTLAMTLFLAGTAVCALALGFVPLLTGRIIQASGTAIMMPLLMTTVMTLVPPSQQGRVMGNISIVISVAPAIGPTISGLVLSVLPWRFLFVVVIPIALGALVLGTRRIESVGETSRARVDVLSVVLSAVGFGGLVHGLSGLGGGGAAPVPLITIAVGAAALAVFVLRQRSLQREDRALLDLRTFASPSFTLAVVLMMLMMGSLFGMVVLLPIYLQDVLGLETLAVGLMLLPGGLLMGLAAPAVGRLYDRVGPRPLIVPGLVLVASGLGLLSTITPATPPALVLVSHLLVSVGLALIFTPLFTTALGAVPPRLISHGSAMVGTVQQVAGAAGTALMVMVMTMGAAAARSHGATVAEGIAAGSGHAFGVGAVIAVVGIPCALGLRAPRGQGAPHAVH